MKGIIVVVVVVVVVVVFLFPFLAARKKMYIMSDKGVAIVLMIISLWCLGSWPALFNLLERRGRVPMHTYMDYTIATYCVAVGFALTLGEIGGSSAKYPNFTTQLFQVQPISVPDPHLSTTLMHCPVCLLRVTVII